jgi:FAD/FMN-containing dehydrogenase
MDDVLADVLLRPEDQGFTLRCSGWNSRVVHRPDYIVAAQTPEHVQQAVRFAARQGLPIYVQSTGHGALAACEGGVLIDTSSIGGVEVDVNRRCATVGAGVRRQELLDAAQIYGFAGLSGSGSHNLFGGDRNIPPAWTAR